MADAPPAAAEGGANTSPPAAAAPAAPAAAASAPPAPPAPAPTRPAPRFDWYQTATTVTLTVMVKDVDGARSTVEVGARHVSAALALPAAGSEFVLDLDMYDALVPGEAAVSYRPAKVEVRLTKAEGAQYMWRALEAAAADVPPAAVKAKVAGLPAAAATGAAPAAPAPAPVPPAAAATAAAATAAPPAPAGVKKAKGKDWDALERAVEAEEAAEKPEGEEALFKLFRQIYAGGDEDTRRAMVKSFQTSGGTVLSTNWKDVAAKDYEAEVTAPEGMEVRRWGQEGGGGGGGKGAGGGGKGAGDGGKP
jgi:hypothetical protein